MVNKRLHHLEIKLLIQYGPPELFSANSAGVWKSRFLEGVLPGHLNESVSCMAGAIKTRWILLHMKSEGGEDVAVNPLASLCLTDSIVLLGFPAAEDSPLRCRCAEEREKSEPGPHTDLNARAVNKERKWVLVVVVWVSGLRGSGGGMYCKL